MDETFDPDRFIRRIGERLVDEFEERKAREIGSASMNKSELADRLTGRLGVSGGAARDAVDGVLKTIGEALANGDEVRIVGFGTFGCRERRARTGRNPRTGDPVEIAALTAPVFRAGKALKDSVNS